MTKTAIWVIIPAYNEGKHLRQVLRDVLRYTDQVVVVDDGSNDNTTATVSEFPIVYLKHPINLGKGSALATGIEYAFTHKKAEAIVTLDSDEQHDPSYLPAFFAQFLNGANVILGVRPLIKPMPIFRRVGNLALSYCVKLLFGVYIPDIVSGYRGFTKPAYKKLQWKSKGYGVEVEMTVAIAKQHIPFKTIQITTLYQNYERGMTILDGVAIVLKMCALRILP